MNAQEIIEYIRTSEKKTPVKVYVWEKEAVEFPGCHVFPAGEGCKIVFGDWADLAPVIEANSDKIEDIVIENDSRNSAIPLLDLKEIPANVKEGLEIVPVSRMGEVLEHALVEMPEAIEWNFEEADLKEKTPAAEGEDAGAALPH